VWKFIGGKILHVIPVVLIVSFAAMFLINLIPGNPAYAILGAEATPSQVRIVDSKLGLDKPLVLRYIEWIGGIFHGNFGTSLFTQQPVFSTIISRLPVTLELALLGEIIALIIAIPLGVLTAYRAGSVVDRSSRAVAAILVSAPGFLTGLLLAYVFGVKLAVLPVTGWVPLNQGVGENLRFALLPSVTLALAQIPIFMQLLRADMIATLQEDFVLAARAKGLPTHAILVRHALRPSLFSLLTLSGVSLGTLLGGTVIVESIFSLPGIGSLLIQSIFNKDFITVQGIAIFIALAYVFINIVVDIGYGVLDPRIRRRSTA
jgi:peptide/nickel transport system permease protein